MNFLLKTLLIKLDKNIQIMQRRFIYLTKLKKYNAILSTRQITNIPKVKNITEKPINTADIINILNILKEVLRESKKNFSKFYNKNKINKFITFSVSAGIILYSPYILFCIGLFVSIIFICVHRCMAYILILLYQLYSGNINIKELAMIFAP